MDVLEKCLKSFGFIENKSAAKADSRNVLWCCVKKKETFDLQIAWKKWTENTQSCDLTLLKMSGKCCQHKSEHQGERSYDKKRG